LLLQPERSVDSTSRICASTFKSVARTRLYLLHCAFLHQRLPWGKSHGAAHSNTQIRSFAETQQTRLEFKTRACAFYPRSTDSLRTSPFRPRPPPSSAPHTSTPPATPLLTPKYLILVQLCQFVCLDTAETFQPRPICYARLSSIPHEDFHQSLTGCVKQHETKVRGPSSTQADEQDVDTVGLRRRTHLLAGLQDRR
jgi:hypothetical protein